MDFVGLPLVMGWELTLACNLRCKHCASSAGLPRTSELSTQEALVICDQFPDLLVQEVTFTGGEPLLRPDWDIIAERLIQHEIRTYILSNGLVLDRKTVDRLKEVGISSIGISLDGIGPTHDRIRGYSGLFQSIIHSIHLLHNAQIPVSVITTANGLNINELPAIMNHLISEGVTGWQIQPVFPLGRVKECVTLQLSKQDYLSLGEFIKKFSTIAKSAGLTIIPADSFGYFTDIDNRQPSWKGCSAGLISCGITSDGRIKGCLSMPDNLTEGDLRKRDLWDIWFDPKSFGYSRKFSTDDLGPFCTQCEMGQECKGGCSAMSYGSSGQFHNDSYCFLGIQKKEICELEKKEEASSKR
ncbi:MAG: radical SAM protein [Methanothrix sp.]